jgi:uncharacterized protein YprB with RNaseH-like and TPR domain
MTLQMKHTTLLQYIRKHRTFVSDYQGDLGVKLLLQNLLKQESVCFDTETTGLDALRNLSVFHFIRKGKGYYVPFQKIS